MSVTWKAHLSLNMENAGSIHAKTIKNIQRTKAFTSENNGLVQN
jgi:hypothetical protein